MAVHSVRRIFCCAALCATLAALESFSQNLAKERMLQQEEPDEVSITSANVHDLETMVQSADEGTVFTFESSLDLPGRVVVNVSRLSFRGNGDDRPTIRCARMEGAFQINSNNVIFEDLIIRDCNRTAVEVFSPENELAPGSRESTEKMSRLKVTFRNVDFIRNARRNSSLSGAIDTRERVVARIISCRFASNEGIKGGAVHHTGISLILRHSSFVKNTAEDGGGAIFVDNSQSPRDPKTKMSIKNCNFSRNEVLRGSDDDSGRVPPESAIFFQFPKPSPSGGAVYAFGVRTVKIYATIFSKNIAVAAGGALHVAENNAIIVDRCRFHRNHLRQPKEDSDPYLQQGGAAFISQSNKTFRLEVSSSSFVENNARTGGALHLVGHEDAAFSVSDSGFSHNRAVVGGGAILLRNVKPLALSSVRFLNNTVEGRNAGGGGAILITNGGGLKIRAATGGGRKTSFLENRASRGGAILGRQAVSLIIGGAVFNANRAKNDGGALNVIDPPDSSEVRILDSRFVDNTARRGGAIFLAGIQSVTLEGDQLSSGQSIFAGNIASEGGGIYYTSPGGQSNVLRIRATTFKNNRALPNSTWVDAVFENVTELAEPSSEMAGKRDQQWEDREEKLLDLKSLNPCRPGGGGAICAVLIGIDFYDDVSVQIRKNSFAENSAEVGGAMVVAMDPNVEWDPDCQPNSRSKVPCKRVILRQSRFEGNRATYAGGGIVVTNLNHVFPLTVRDLPAPNQSHLPLSEDDGNHFEDNSVRRKGGYGRHIAGGGVKLFTDSSIVELGTRRSRRLLPRIEIQTTDALNQVVSDGITDSLFPVHVKLVEARKSSQLSGQVLSDSKKGVAVFSDLYLHAKPGNSTLEFFFQSDILRVARVKVYSRGCYLGETSAGDRSGVCEGCPFEYFTFYSNSDCRKKPENSRCEGNALLVPNPGYWHSSPFSVIMHACISKEACSYTGRTEKLQSERKKRLSETPGMLDAETALTILGDMYPQCTTGYEGPICGSCARGYGRASRNECRKCSSLYVSVLVFALLASWQLILLLMTTRSALVSVHDIAQMAAVLRRQTMIRRSESLGLNTVQRNELVVGSEELADEPEENTIQGTSSRAAHQRRSRMSGNESSTSAVEAAANTTHTAECIVTTQYLSETIKIIINFLQIASVVAGIDLNWAVSFKKMLATFGSAAGLSGATSFSSTLCILDTVHDDRAVYNVVMQTALPVLLLSFLLSGYLFQWFRAGRTSSASRTERQAFMKSRIIVSCFVTCFFAYQSYSETFIGIFSCIEIDSKELSWVRSDYDDEENGAYYSIFSVARGNYWTIDTTVECFKGSHAYLTGFLGVPGVLFLGTVPVYLLIFLLYSRRKNKLKDIAVLNTHGFIYQNYKDRFVYWEAFILVRKALIAVIIVFAYPLGANLQAVLTLGILILALIFHMLAYPFKYRLLNFLECCSLSVSISTLLIGLVFNDTNTSHAAFVFLSAVLICINSVLVLAFAYALLILLDKLAAAKLKLNGIAEIPENPFSRMSLFATFHFDNAVAFVKAIALGTLEAKDSSHPETGSDHPSLPQEDAL